ncbi:MAG: class I fructose-bisphosphate aldolase [Mucilaginibacter sp.]
MKTDQQPLVTTARQLMAGKKGILAMDESTATCNKRFKAQGIPETEEYRRKYRELLVTTHGLEEYINGAILFDETIKQSTVAGDLFIDILVKKGIIPGIKVDAGTVSMAGFMGEKVTEGLDGLRERLAAYKKLGARFAKWRAVFSIGTNTPTVTCIKTNANVLAQYAALCQETGLVPFVEPEVLMDGGHSIEKCAEVTNQVLQAVFNALHRHRVNLEGIILKPNMVLPGIDHPIQNNNDEIARATIACLLNCVPASVPGIAFLSGGQPTLLATERLNAMHRLFNASLPWALTFSFSRALQQPALEIWKGNDANINAAQQSLLHRAACNHAACMGSYTPEMEKVIPNLIY